MSNINGLGELGEGGLLSILCATDAGASEKSTEGAPQGAEPELEEAARDERDYVRRRLREETGREPTPEELDEWLRQHTEGY